MDRTDLFLGLIVVLLAAQVHEVGNGHMPMFIVLSMVAILYLFPVYLAGAVVLENVVDGRFTTHETGSRDGRCLFDSDSDGRTGAFPASDSHGVS